MQTGRIDRGLIEAVIANEIRPQLRVHGGDVALIDVTDGDIELEFMGSCRACAFKSVTYAIGVRERLVNLPGVRSVRVSGISLSDAAIERVVTAYRAHPLLKTEIRATGETPRTSDMQGLAWPVP
ncbi:hypothetical protein WI58_06185 [Burkholderia cepacia]|nr:hypothetical protein WI47_34440 [Burkholderia cepacia]KVA64611.1 hypothetical protein WI49_17450 [Burkholderia cepacia]KVA64794.1 hypothetical protein WI48_05795 [Burkholderia cepacia]KVA86694.1 hypothetical protein WI50_14995 [Burkholderia cepacia]KVA96007.1 hypothetical protein WI52_34175 [Burkholderia cepacia]